MVYSLETFAIVGLLSFAFGVLLGLLFLSEEKPSERARRIGLELRKSELFHVQFSVQFSQASQF
jgi:hypothetical protein